MVSRDAAIIRRMKRRLRAEQRQPCMRCGQPIDYDAPPNEPDSFNMGHVLSWRNHPELRADWGNVQQEHARCNQSAGPTEGNVYSLGARSGLL